jgi:pyrroline-5-carboxylate reductase
MSSELPTVAFIGVGTMMEAMVDKAIEGGWPRERLLLTHRRAERREELAKRFGTAVSGENLETVAKADMIVLGVRPQEMADVVAGLRPAFRADQTLISIAAGLTVDWLAARLPPGMTIVRVTPPPTAWVSAGVTLISGGVDLSDAAKAHIERLVKSTCHRTQWIPDAMMEPITGVALALTPYSCALLKTLIETGVEQGCDEAFIRGLVMEGFQATARLFKEGGFTPEQVIDMVATREGLTWSSLHTMEAYNVFRGIRMGARAMTGRSYELRGETVPDDYVGFLR